MEVTRSTRERGTFYRRRPKKGAKWTVAVTVAVTVTVTIAVMVNEAVAAAHILLHTPPLE
jgi:hypothetical protein